MPDVTSALRAYANEFEAALPGFLPRGDSPVEQAMRYGMEAGGKRIRPALVLAFRELFGGQAEHAMPLAMAVEMVHGYSLIHDDLPCMDDDDFRRGRPSCHKQFGEAIALLAGDALLTEAFQSLAYCELPPMARLQAVGILSRNAGFRGMVGGQQEDLLLEKTPATLLQLHKMNDKKTGALIRTACLFGCLAAGTFDQEHDPRTEAASSYAQHLGILFQLTDDILDVTGNPETLGKTPGKDEAAGKSTWVSVLGLERAQNLALEYAEEAREAIAPYAGEGHFLYELPGWLIIRNM